MGVGESSSDERLVILHCSRCGATFPTVELAPTCPRCGSEQIDEATEPLL